MKFMKNGVRGNARLLSLLAAVLLQGMVMEYGLCAARAGSDDATLDNRGNVSRFVFFDEDKEASSPRVRPHGSASVIDDDDNDTAEWSGDERSDNPEEVALAPRTRVTDVVSNQCKERHRQSARESRDRKENLFKFLNKVFNALSEIPDMEMASRDDIKQRVEQKVAEHEAVQGQLKHYAAVRAAKRYLPEEVRHKQSLFSAARFRLRQAARIKVMSVEVELVYARLTQALQESSLSSTSPCVIEAKAAYKEYKEYAVFLRTKSRCKRKR